MDLGPPVSYQALAEGTAVLSSDGQPVGKVAHVLFIESEDVFDGIVVTVHPGPEGHRFADADVVGTIHEDGVVLKLDHDACAALPQPSANPAVMRDDPGAPGASPLGDKLRRAWDRLSGNY